MLDPDAFIPVADFWDIVRTNPQGRYEYIHGMVRSLHILNMGAMNRHERLVARLSAQFDLKLGEKNSPCAVFASNTFFFLSEEEGNEEYVLPDLSISCDQQDLTREKGILHPSVIVEVLSRGTAQGDRTWKKDDYLACPSIQSYLIVDPDHPLITVYHRQEDGSFQEIIYHEQEQVVLHHPDLTIAVDDVYARIL